MAIIKLSEKIFLLISIQLIRLLEKHFMDCKGLFWWIENGG